MSEMTYLMKLLSKTMAILLALLVPALAWGQSSESVQEAQAGTLSAAAQATTQSAAGEAAGQEEGEQGEQEAPQIHDIRFVYVEGSLPYVPTSNTIATKLPLELRLTPFNVGSVTEALIRDQYSQVLSQTLVNISNINIQPGFGVHDFFTIRGFDSLSSGLVLTDGASEPETTFYQLYNVDAVEVLKGPSGFLYGSNPLAGAVNMVRKQPLPRTVTTVAGNFGSYQNFQGTLDFNYASPERDYALRLNGLARDTDSFRDEKWSRTFAINPALTWWIDDASSLNVNFEYVDADAMPDTGLPLYFGYLPEVPRERNYQSPFDASEQGIFRFQTDYQRDIREDLEVRNKLYYRDLDWLSAGTLFLGVFPRPQFDSVGRPVGFSEEVVRNLIVVDDRQRSVGNQFETVFDFTTGSIGHNLLAGFEFARFGDVYTFDVALLPNINYQAPEETAAEPLFFLPDQSLAGDSRSIVAAPYVIDQIWFADQFQLLVGARLDHIDFKDDANGISRIDNEVSPMIGAVYAPSEAVSVFANYSRSFAPPVARVQDGERVPEEGREIEGGVKLQLLDGRAKTTFAVYRLERKNIAIPDDNGFTQQVGDQQSTGFEVDFAAEVRLGLQTVASYAYNDAELTRFAESVLDMTAWPPAYVTVDRSGNTPAFAPSHIFNFWVSKIFRGGLGLGGGGRYVSEQFIAEDNDVVLDGVLTFDAAASYSFAAWQVQLNVKNLTNREYFGRAFGANSVIPAPPLTAYVGFDVQF
jgi:TonB-dependent siderophore receptor